MPTTHQVVKIETHYYLTIVEKKQTWMLLAFDHGDPCCPCSKTLMHSALYDFHQCHDDLQEGDRIETPHGVFYVSGLHVEAYESETKAEAKARRARLRRIGRRQTA